MPKADLDLLKGLEHVKKTTTQELKVPNLLFIFTVLFFLNLQRPPAFLLSDIGLAMQRWKIGMFCITRTLGNGVDCPFLEMVFRRGPCHPRNLRVDCVHGVMNYIWIWELQF